MVLAVAAVAGLGAWAVQRRDGRREPTAGITGAEHVRSTTGAAAKPRSPTGRRQTEKRADRLLTVSLERLLRSDSGSLAVGAIDLGDGVRVLSNADLHVHTASIVKADILAALLLQHQATGDSLSAEQRELATEMIEHSDNDAATDLWGQIGGASGLAAANARLGLHETVPGAAGYWGLTSTTISDQLRLLADLVLRRSPLVASSRSFELSLMRSVESDQAWGVSAAATAGTSAAVKNGWLPDPELWVINSIGLVDHAGRRLLLVVLSKNQPSEAYGISQCEGAALAAARAVTRTASNASQ